MKITPSVRKALGAVTLGEVVRVYRRDGNILRGPTGVSALTLWRLSNARWIEDGKHATGALEKTCAQVLTKAGRDALAQ